MDISRLPNKVKLVQKATAKPSEVSNVTVQQPWKIAHKAVTVTSTDQLLSSEQGLTRKLIEQLQSEDDFDGAVADVFAVPQQGDFQNKQRCRDMLHYFFYIKTHIGFTMDTLVAVVAIIYCGVVICNLYTGTTIFNSAGMFSFDAIVSAYFLFDYVMRLLLAPRSWHYASSSLAITELITITPIFVELIASQIIMQSSIDNLVLLDVIQCCQAVRILRLTTLTRLAPKKLLSRHLYITCLILVTIVCFSSVLFQIAERNYGEIGENASIPFHRALCK